MPASPQTEASPSGVTSPYHWTFTKRAYYGRCGSNGCQTDGSVQQSHNINMNGGQVQNGTSLHQQTGPALRQGTNYYCRRVSDNADCGDDGAESSNYDFYNWTTDGNWYPWKGGSRYTTKWYDYVFALGIRNPSTSDGRFNLPEVTSAQYKCNPGCVFP